MSKKNKVFFVDYDKNDSNRTLLKSYYNKKDKIKLLTYYFLVGEKLVLTEGKAIKIPFDKYNIETISINQYSLTTKEKYSRSFVDKSLINCVLIFETPTAKIAIKNYKSSTIKILDIFHKVGYKVYIKPHPYKGYSSFLSKYAVSICDQKIPAELIKTSQFNYIFGINSRSLATLSMEQSDHVWSLINLYKYRDLNEKNKNINNLTIQSNNNVLFIQSPDHLKQILIKDNRQSNVINFKN